MTGRVIGWLAMTAIGFAWSHQASGGESRSGQDKKSHMSFFRGGPLVTNDKQLNRLAMLYYEFAVDSEYASGIDHVYIEHVGKFALISPAFKESSYQNGDVIVEPVYFMIRLRDGSLAGVSMYRRPSEAYLDGFRKLDP